MKIRNGFVSNSSSSSFMIIARADYFEEKLDSLDPEIKKIAEKSIDHLTQLSPGLCMIKAKNSDGIISGLATAEEYGSEAERAFSEISKAIYPSQEERRERVFYEFDYN